jgi:hypothetical protein
MNPDNTLSAMDLLAVLIAKFGGESMEVTITQVDIAKASGCVMLNGVTKEGALALKLVTHMQFKTMVPDAP